jgi:hypothetical protein
MTLPNAILQAAYSSSMYSTLTLDRDAAKAVTQLIGAAQELRAIATRVVTRDPKATAAYDDFLRALAALEGHRA